MPGLMFKKNFSDGKYISFNLISQKKQHFLLQSLYIDSVSYQKRKSANPVLMQNAPASTPKARGGQTSNTSISQKSDLSRVLVNVIFNTIVRVGKACSMI